MHVVNTETKDGGGIRGRIKWADRAAAMIKAREYRYLSPVLMRLKDRRVTRIAGAGLGHGARA